MRRARHLVPVAMVVALGGLGSAIAVRAASPLLRALGHVGQAQMAANWLAFGVGQALIAATGIIPASLIAVMAGASYGLFWGAIISAVSTIVGGWAAFGLGRSMFRGLVERRLRHHPAMARLDQGIVSEGWRFVMLLRVSPVMPFALTSYGLGLTPVSQRDFLLGTLASLPAMLGYVALGAFGRESMLVAGGAGDMMRLATLAVGCAVVFYAFWRIQRAMAPTVA